MFAILIVMSSITDIEISRLIHHHLLKEFNKGNGLKSSNRECPHYRELKNVFEFSVTDKLPRLIGPSLQELLEEYFQTKDFVIEELEFMGCKEFRAQDSLVTLMRILVQNLKLYMSVVQHHTAFDKSNNPPPSITENNIQAISETIADVSGNIHYHEGISVISIYLSVKLIFHFL